MTEEGSKAREALRTEEMAHLISSGSTVEPQSSAETPCDTPRTPEGEVLAVGDRVTEQLPTNVREQQEVPSNALGSVGELHADGTLQIAWDEGKVTNVNSAWVRRLQAEDERRAQESGLGVEERIVQASGIQHLSGRSHAPYTIRFGTIFGNIFQLPRLGTWGLPRFIYTFGSDPTDGVQARPTPIIIDRTGQVHNASDNGLQAIVADTVSTRPATPLQQEIVGQTLPHTSPASFEQNQMLAGRSVKGIKFQMLRRDQDMVLTNQQLQALSNAYAVSSHGDAAATHKLRERCSKKDINYEELLLWVVNDAPLIVHLNFGKKLGNGQFLVDVMLRDGRLKNVFEVAHSGGHAGGSTDTKARAEWEDRLFVGAYDDAPPEERVVYGTINLTNTECGVRDVVFCGYGESYLELKPSVRWRCTLFDRDSSDPHAKGAVDEKLAHFLTRFTDDELFAIATHAGDEHLQSYPEIQVHGDVVFAEHVSKVVLDPNLETVVLDKVIHFCKVNNLQYAKIGECNIPMELKEVRDEH